MKDHVMRHPLPYQFHCIVRGRQHNGTSYTLGTWIVDKGEGRIDTDAGPIACRSIRKATRTLYARLDPDHALKRVPRWMLQWQYSLTPMSIDIPGFLFSTIQYTPTPTPWMRWPSLQSVTSDLSAWLSYKEQMHALLTTPNNASAFANKTAYNNSTVRHRRLGRQDGIMADIHPNQVSGQQSIMIPEPERCFYGIPIERHHTIIHTPVPPPYAITTSMDTSTESNNRICLIHQDTRAIMAELPTDISTLHQWLKTHMPTPPITWFSSHHARTQWARHMESQLDHIIESIVILSRDIRR